MLQKNRFLFQLVSIILLIALIIGATPGQASSLSQPIALGTPHYLPVVMVAVTTAPTTAPIIPTPTTVPSDETPISPPTAPTNLSAIALSENHIQLNWQDNSLDEWAFQVIGGDNWVIGSTTSNNTTFVVADLNPDTYYCFRVFASISGIWSIPTDWACARTQKVTLQEIQVTESFVNGNTLVAFSAPVDTTVPNAAVIMKTNNVTHTVALEWMTTNCQVARCVQGQRMFVSVRVEEDDVSIELPGITLPFNIAPSASNWQADGQKIQRIVIPATPTVMPTATATPAPTFTPVPTITSTPDPRLPAPPPPPSTTVPIASYNFANSPQGWYIGEESCKDTEVKSLLIGDQWVGQFSSSLYNDPECQRHVEALVRMDLYPPQNTPPAGWYNWTGKQISCLIWIPKQMGDRGLTVRMGISDLQWDNEFLAETDVTSAYTGEWQRLILKQGDPEANRSPNYDPAFILAWKVRVDLAASSNLLAVGPIFYLTQCRVDN